jgi:DNA-directed RNA polymerase subunit H (RpoH/RPB5)
MTKIDFLSELGYKIEMTNRLAKVKEIILEMFVQRGYTDIDDTGDNRIIAITQDGNQICAFAHIIEKLNVSEIQTHISHLQEMQITHGLLVHEGTPTPAVKNVVNVAPDLNLTIELFHADDLQFNATKNLLVPPHVRLSRDEARKLKALFDTKQLPTLKTDDVIALFYNYRKGDIIKIVRKSSIAYRVVR